MHDYLPDVADQGNKKQNIIIERVGMEGITVPSAIPCNDKNILVALKASAHVDLVRAESRGIHMSRLFRAVTDRLDHSPLSVSLLKDVLSDMLESHVGISQSAGLSLTGRLPLSRTSLLSKLSGYRSYPFVISAMQTGKKLALKLEVQILYSSTCPASAALARQMNARAFNEHFQEREQMSKSEVVNWLHSLDGLAATPHAQRSSAHIAISLCAQTSDLPLFELINCLEQAIMTPVQTSVKRIDEQEFARLNAQHLKFAEDAVRTLHEALSSCAYAEDFAIKVSHWESLHAHNAVAFASKNPQGGLDYRDLSLSEITYQAEGL